MPREYQYPFELRHLVYFRELAHQLHFRKAAETLAVAQPALSRALAQLEAALGADLLNRTRRGAELTITPCIPRDWPSYRIDYRFGTALYRIEITRSGKYTETPRNVLSRSRASSQRT